MTSRNGFPKWFWNWKYAGCLPASAWTCIQVSQMPPVHALTCTKINLGLLKTALLVFIWCTSAKPRDAEVHATIEEVALHGGPCSQVLIGLQGKSNQSTAKYPNHLTIGKPQASCTQQSHAYPHSTMHHYCWLHDGLHLHTYIIYIWIY